jgi:hypothetical protein
MKWSIIFQGIRKKDHFVDMKVSCSIDGVSVGSMHIREGRLLSTDQRPGIFDGRDVSSTERRLFKFAAPVRSWSRHFSYLAQAIFDLLQVLTEDATPSLKVSNIRTILVKFRRANAGKSRVVKQKKKSVVPEEDDEVAVERDVLVGD